MCDEKIDILIQYQNISNKLRKKKILKKPNVAEACQQFENLGRICEREDLGQYAGLSYQAAAKCQNSLGNVFEEGYLFLKSSRQFMQSYLNLLNNNSVVNESYLYYSLASYEQCLKRLQENEECSKMITEMIMGEFTLKMGDDLNQKADAIEESCQNYSKAIKLFSNSPLEKINSIQRLVSSYIKLGKYNLALKFVEEVVSEASKLPFSGSRTNILKNAEIVRIFLLLILQPMPQQISSEAAAALEKYAWVETFNSSDIRDLQNSLKDKTLSMLSESLFLKLQSLVMACQYGEREILNCIESDLISHLNLEQKLLLKILIKQYVNCE